MDVIRSGIRLCGGFVAVAALGALLGVVILKATQPLNPIYAVAGPRPDRYERKPNILDELRIQHSHARTAARVAERMNEMKAQAGLDGRDMNSLLGK